MKETEAYNVLNWKKNYIIIAGAVASGKTTLAKNLSVAYGDCFYFDKDDLGALSEVPFKIVGEKYDRHGDYFKRYVRDPEYDVSERITLKGLSFTHCVIQNAPYTGEIKTEADGGESERLHRLFDAVHAHGAKMLIVFVECDRETVRAHLIKRGKESPDAFKRDRYIYDDIDAFLDTQNLTVPPPGAVRHTDALFAFDAKDPKASFRKLKAYLGIESDMEYDPEIREAIRKADLGI